ncbi:uncharacterized protein LOC127080342 [Lathyrus oleraceus]|uniref:uncharacterized protein LOC127080342 n=1 Tax=Pisum sativum TaxID=3888 RepID=UPI0021D0B858|nr:uncharacterized protein LOC127080342 [Pisum sativum]
MVGSMVIDTLTNGLMTMLWVCLNCPLTIYGKKNGMDLVCRPLNKIDVILGMIWLEFNHVHINYFDKSVLFPEFDASVELFVSAKQVDEFMKEGAEVFMILASMKAESKYAIRELPMVCDFPKVFPDDISDLSLEREVEFSIDLVIDTSPLWTDPYRTYASELSGF